jgi:hypothetical protein
MIGLKFDDVIKQISEIYKVVNNAFGQYLYKHFPFFLGKHREVVMIQFQRTTVYWSGGCGENGPPISAIIRHTSSEQLSDTQYGTSFSYVQTTLNYSDNHQHYQAFFFVS